MIYKKYENREKIEKLKKTEKNINTLIDLILSNITKPETSLRYLTIDEIALIIFFVRIFTLTFITNESIDGKPYSFQTFSYYLLNNFNISNEIINEIFLQLALLKGKPDDIIYLNFFNYLIIILLFTPITTKTIDLYIKQMAFLNLCLFSYNYKNMIIAFTNLTGILPNEDQIIGGKKSKKKLKKYN